MHDPAHPLHSRFLDLLYQRLPRSLAIRLAAALEDPSPAPRLDPSRSESGDPSIGYIQFVETALLRDSCTEEEAHAKCREFLKWTGEQLPEELKTELYEKLPYELKVPILEARPSRLPPSGRGAPEDSVRNKAS